MEWPDGKYIVLGRNCHDDIFINDNDEEETGVFDSVEDAQLEIESNKVGDRELGLEIEYAIYKLERTFL